MQRKRRKKKNLNNTNKVVLQYNMVELQLYTVATKSGKRRIFGENKKKDKGQKKFRVFTKKSGKLESLI